MRCPNCGWENPDNNAKCEKCNTPLKAGNSYLGETLPDSDYEVSPTAPDEPAPSKPAEAGKFSKTVPGWMGVPMTIARCKFSPVAMVGENPKYIPGEALFKGDYNELTRENLDPDNMTITTKVQAVLTHKEDGWYIEDKSAQHTTLIQVTSPTKIKSGDVILMGNRLFLFSEE